MMKQPRPALPLAKQVRPAAKLESPCVDICVIDQASRLCTGCGRTIDEISKWASMTSSERLTIMAQLPTRQNKT